MMEKGYLSSKDTWRRKQSLNDLPILLSDSRRDQRCFINIFKKHVNKYSGKFDEVLEIGCSPGKFLIYFAENLGCKPYGIDLDEGRCELTRQNLLSRGLTGEIVQADIFEHDFGQKFKLIISCGFIEHFENETLQKVLGLHSDLVEKNGLLFLSFPNFRNLNYLLASVFRRDILKLHNIEIMHKDFFRAFAEKYGFEIVYLEYFGGIHLGGFKFFEKSSSKNVLAACYNLALKRFDALRILDRINSRCFSHYLGAVLRKQ